MTPIEQVPAENWQGWTQQNDAVLLDIRQPEEWRLGTLPGVQMIPMTEIMERFDEVPKDKKILCICRGGGRSQQVASFLSFHGYDVANMDGGMHALGLQD